MNQDDGIDDAWIDAQEAASRLEVQRATLYAYVSRGLVRRSRAEGRKSRYHAGDVARLAARSAARAGHAAVASGALRFGEPVLDTAISEVTPRGPAYRGRDSVALAAQGARFEAVCEWLWEAEAPLTWEAPAADARTLSRLSALLPKGARPIDVMRVALPLCSLRDADRYEPAGDARLRRGTRIVRSLCAALALSAGADAKQRLDEALAAPSVASAILSALGAKPTKRACAAIDVALIVIADHELNSSSFAARVAGGADADLYACVEAALATLAGPRHGGACDRVEALMGECREPEDAIHVIRARRQRGDAIPGFGHPFYPEGDPRTPPLFEAAEAAAPRRPAGLRILRALSDAMALAGGPAPSVDLGLVALASALGLPPGSGLALFAIGRCAGWVAHAIEQKEAGWQVRPRARYVGTPAT